jgi:uncharacterized protein (TIRG00374 family)
VLLQLTAGGLRWFYISQSLNAKLNLIQSLKLSFIGQFFNQILPSSIGGDAAKIWIATREGVGLGRAASTAISDRFSGLIVNIMIPTISFIIFPISWPPNFSQIGAGLVLSLLLTFVVLVFLYFFNENSVKKSKLLYLDKLIHLLNDLKITLFKNKKRFWILVLSVAIQSLNIFIIYAIAKSLHTHIALNFLIILVPTIMLISIVPISLAGWGLREALMVFGLSFANVAELDAISISILFGLVHLASAILGLIFFINYFYFNKND